ncbi:MAG: hypothetical protein ACK5KO_05995 [Arachnia sp.]
MTWVYGKIVNVNSHRTLILVGILALVAGCSGSPEAPSPFPAHTSPWEAPSSTHSVSPEASAAVSDGMVFPEAPEGEEPATAAIREGLEGYWRAWYAHMSAPTVTDFTDVVAATTPTGDARNGVFLTLEGLKERGVKIEGAYELRDVEINPATTGEDGASAALVTYCADSSGIVVVADAPQAQPTLTPTPTLEEQMWLSQHPNGKWVADTITNQRAAC